MSDPFSIAGSAVGIISLGLHVCGEIVSFCQTWQGFSEDIQNIHRKANGLRMPLRSLRQLIEDFHTTDPMIASDLVEKAKSIEQAMKRLKAATDRYSSIASDQASLRLKLKKAAYPFRKEALRDMASDLDSVQAVLDTALLVYSTQSNRALLGKMTQEMQAMHLKIQDLPKHFMPPPSLLQSWCAQRERLPELSSTSHIETRDDDMIKNTSNKTSRAEPCSGSCRKEAARGTLVTCQHHSPGNGGCTSYSRRSRKERKVIKASFYYCSSMLNFAIRASFSLKMGAGGYSIAPLLHLQPLLDKEHSVAYHIFTTFCIDSFHRCATSRDYELLVDHIIQRLQQAFDLQKATPFDKVELYGRETSLFELFYSRHLQRLIVERIEHTSRLLAFLLDCGSKPNMNYNHKSRYIGGHRFAFFKEQCSLGSRLLDLGCSINIYAPRSLAERQGIRDLLFQDYESIQLPSIARIILQESEDGLRDALNSGTASPNDTIDGISTLIEYAFGWPKGIQILLEAGAVPSEPIGSRRSIRWVEDDYTEDTYQSIKLLIEAGWPFGLDDISFCEKFESSGKIKLLLINEMVARKKRLWHLAQSCLPASQLPKLISEDEKTGEITILDIHTSEILARLRKQGIPMEPALQLSVSEANDHFQSIYHYSSFSVETLGELYQVGFRGFTQLDSQGFLPLMTLINSAGAWSEHIASRKGIERLAWLVSKGADPYQKVPGTSATVAHHLGVRMVDDLRFGFGVTRISREFDPQEFYRDWKQNVLKFGKSFFLLPSVRDECVCACSPSGCTTMSVVLRYIVGRIHTRQMEEPRLWFRELIPFLLWWTQGDVETGWEVIQFLTFDALGLKHSCCIEECIDRSYVRVFRSREEEEVEEIRDEESLRITELEQLLDKLRINFDDLGQPVMEFLEGYWYTCMIDHLSQRDPYDEKHIIESKRIGVELEPEEFVVPDRVSLLIRPKIISENST